MKSAYRILFIPPERLGCCSVAPIISRSVAAVEGRPLLPPGRARAPVEDKLPAGVSAMPAVQASTTYVVELELFFFDRSSNVVSFVCL